MKASIAQQTALTEEKFVAVHWIFYDKSNLNICTPRVIKVPESHFRRAAQLCRTLFVAEILKEFSFQAKENSVRFWMPEKPLLLQIAEKLSWVEEIHDPEDFCKQIPLPKSFSTILEGIVNEKNVVHLVVTASGSYHDLATELPEIKRYHKIVSTPGKSPSEGAKSPEYVCVQARANEAIYDGRYPYNPQFSTVAPPIQMFHPIFDEFTQLVSDPSNQPTNHDIRRVQELMHLLSCIRTWEPMLNATIYTKLTDILQTDVHEEPNTDRTTADNVHMFRVGNVRIPLLIMELKRELGDAGCDPSTQAGIMMRQSWIQNDREAIRDRCCCPTMILVGGGPWLGVLGGVFTDKVIVQRLTDLMWVAHSSTEEDSRVYRFAQVLIALRLCLLRLQSFYKDIGSDLKIPPIKSGHTHPRFYPYPTSFTDENGTSHFEYVRMMETDATCVTYKARLLESDNSPHIVVKFVSRYGANVHKFLAENNHAPRLHYCGPLSDIGVLGDERSLESPAQPPPGVSLGPMQMIVMDFVSECKDTPSDARQQLEIVLEKLHCAGYVFGDLRLQNILFDEEGKVKLIDFDWSGRYDMNIRDDSLLPANLQKKIDEKKKDAHDESGGNYICYPLNLSRNVEWAPGVKDLEPIRPHHDWDMLRRLGL